MAKSLKAIWTNKCPRCRKGNLFVDPFEFGNPLNMNAHCEVCEKNFEPEPGYYFGAMFLSYAITTFTLLPLALFLVFYFKWNIEGAMAFVFFIGLISFFKVLRVSRSLWIHIMVKYDPYFNNS